MQIILHPLAEAEIIETARFYEDRAPGLGENFLHDFERALAQISDAPEAGAPMGQTVRRVLLKRFPFSILYRPLENELRILAVMHHRRRPGYWKNRG
jgi:plasmid stabilization system protein ParE